MATPGTVTSYAPNQKTTTNAIDAAIQKAATETRLPVCPTELSKTIEASVAQIGRIAADELDITAQEIMEAAEHVAGQYTRLAEAMRAATNGHAKAAAEFCSRLRTSFDTVRSLAEAFNPAPETAEHEQSAGAVNHGGGGSNGSTGGEGRVGSAGAAPQAPEEPAPGFLTRARNEA